MKLNNLLASRRQRGITLISVIIIGILLVFLLIVAFRCVPVLNEYFAIKRTVYAISTNAHSSMSDYDIVRDFDAQTYIDHITSITGDDLVVSRPDGKVVISFKYSRTVPLFANVSLLFDFDATTQDPR